MSIRKTWALYGLAFAVGTFALHWLESQYAVQLFSTEIYIVVLASFFTGLGIWIGSRFRNPVRGTEFQKNDRVITTLGLTAKELEVLELLAAGGSNQEMASRLFVSRSTVKTHLVHLYRKLNVSRRTQAVEKARSLQIIP